MGLGGLRAQTLVVMGGVFWELFVHSEERGSCQTSPESGCPELELIPGVARRVAEHGQIGARRASLVLSFSAKILGQRGESLAQSVP